MSELHQAVRLAKQHDRDGFDCGVVVLNEYLRKYAVQNEKKYATRTYVVARDGKHVLGYYSLAYTSIEPSEATKEVRSGLGRYPIPAILVARLAVDRREQGKGIGKFLLRDVLLRSIRGSEIAGLRAILVHAKDARARAFYEQFDFQQSPLDELQLMVDMKSIRAML